MASEKTVDVTQLAVWKAKHAALGRLIESYEEAERIGALGGLFDPTDMSNGFVGGSIAAGAAVFAGAGTVATMPTELPVGAFLNMSIPEAIRLYLSAVKRKQTAREIAAALKDGGMESTAANWETTVTGALHRLKTTGHVLRFKDGWGLADFYPDSLRARIAKEAKPKKFKIKRTKKPVPTRGIKLRDSNAEEGTN